MNSATLWRTMTWTGAMLLAGGAWAGRPLAIDDADPVDPLQCEFEVGAGYADGDGVKHTDMSVGLTMGVLSGLEAGLGLGGQFEKRTERSEETGVNHTERDNGIGDLTLGAKWQFTDSWPFGVRQALAPAVKFPTADEDKGLGSGEYDVDLTWIASRSIGEKAGVHVNFGYSWIGGPDADAVHGGLALDYQLVEALQWVGEVFAEQECTGGAESVVQGNTGLRWSPLDSLTLDLAGGTKIHGDAPDWTATAGLTWAFGFE